MEAMTILQGFLDEVSQAVFDGDWDTYRSGVDLPFSLVTHAANVVVATEAELRTGFDAFHETLRAQRVTHYIRLAKSAERTDPGLICGSYVSHLLADGKHVAPPYASQITLRLVGDRWRAVSISNALTNKRWPMLLPSIVDRAPPESGQP